MGFPQKKRFFNKLFLLIPLLIPGFYGKSSGQSLCWKVSGNGITKPSFIYGTFHIGDKKVYNLGKAQEYFDEADAFFAEINMDSANSMEVIKYFMLDSGRVLKDLFTPDDYSKLEAWFKTKMNMGLENFQSYTPFFIISLVQQAMFSNEMGEALDLHLFKEAKEKGIEVHGIETIMEQVSAIATIPEKAQVKMLMESISDSVDAEAMSKKLLKIYLKGDLDKLLEYSNENGMDKEFEENLIINRNHIMADRVAPFFKDKSCFVAVGAAHLPGEEGVLELLRKKGYTVEAVKK